MNLHGPTGHPTKLGTLTVVDMGTGEVVAEKRNAMTMLPPPPDRCQECAGDHRHDQPHNQQSLFYQMWFQARHGRAPTWSDAMAHCSPEIQAKWRQGLIEVMRQHKLPVPDDLLHPKPAGR